MSCDESASEACNRYRRRGILRFARPAEARLRMTGFHEAGSSGTAEETGDAVEHLAGLAEAEG